MHEITDECVSCDLPCLGSACPKMNVIRYYCDNCGDETQLYNFNGEELCIDCIEERLDKINED